MNLKKVFILFVILLTILLLIPACASNRGTANTSLSDNSTQPPTGVTLPPVTDTDRGNPKLAGVLVRLIQAEKQGKAESFARQRVIQLQDDNVFVTIKSVPGQAEAAAKAATSAGAKIGRPTKTCWMHLCL